MPCRLPRDWRPTNMVTGSIPTNGAGTGCPTKPRPIGAGSPITTAVGCIERDGWFWIPGDEWAPAWVDWRYSNDYVGWAPLPPDDLIDAYDEEPGYWVFVAPRYLTAPRLAQLHRAARNRRGRRFRATPRRQSHRCLSQGAAAAVNPGISPAFIASVTRRSVPAYRVSPRVLARTQGVTGAGDTSGGRLARHGPAAAAPRCPRVVRCSEPAR